MEKYRIVITVLTPFVLWTFKWLVVAWAIRLPGVKQLCLKLFRTRQARFEGRHQLVLIGWDLAAASVGLYVASKVLSGSRFNVARESLGPLGGFLSDTYFLFFAGLLVLAMAMRYVLVETAERTGRYRAPCAVGSWCVGTFLMYLTGCFAQGVS